MPYSFPRTSQYTFQVGRSFAGLGLFATADIPGKDTFLIEYFGTFLSGDEADKKGGKYLFEITDDLVIDGTARNNIARYINHSCKPNCYAQVEGKRVFIYAKRKIKEGEELTYNYGKEYWEDVITPNGCKCGHCMAKRKSAKSTLRKR